MISRLPRARRFWSAPWIVCHCDAFPELQHNDQLEILFDRRTRAGAARGRLFSANPNKEVRNGAAGICERDHGYSAGRFFDGCADSAKEQ